MKFLALCVTAVVFLQLIDEGKAECCTAFPYTSQCKDCTKGTPFCGYQSCNIFGCNCGGGCRTGSCKGKKRSESSSIETAHDVIRAADVDGDGRMSMEEAHVYLTSTGVPSYHYKRSLMELDADNDYFLTAEEID